MESVVANNFFSKHKLKLIMLAPVLAGLSFFVFSSISALITINSVSVPEDFQKINLKVKEYQVTEIDRNTHKKKWTLKAKSAVSDLKHTNAKIKDAHMEMFENDKVSFVLESDYAQINETEKEVNLFDNVKVVHANGDYVINSGELKYKDSDEYFYLKSNWDLKSHKGFTIKGSEGKIKKDFSELYSNGNASINNKDFNLSAKNITVEKDKATLAEGNSILKLNAKNSSLHGDSISINNDGSIDAQGSIKVKNDKIQCYSDELNIQADAKKKPSLAVFTGNPYIIQNDKKIYADLITYNFNTGKATVEGNVHTGS